MWWGCLGPAWGLGMGPPFRKGNKAGVAGSSIRHGSRKARRAREEPGAWRASWLRIGAKSSLGSFFPALSLPNLTPSQSHHKGLRRNLLSWWMMQGAAP